MGKRYAVIYQRGGRVNFSWHRSIAYDDKGYAAQVRDDLMRMGYPALVADYDLSVSPGLPDTWAGDDAPACQPA